METLYIHTTIYFSYNSIIQMSTNNPNIENLIGIINNHFNPSSNNIILEKRKFDLSLDTLIKTGNSECIRKIITKMCKDTNQDINLLRLCNAVNSLIDYLMINHHTNIKIEKVIMI